MQGYDVLIVGAGLAGATMANLFAGKGLKVLVVEKRKQVAGNCFDYKDANNITVHRYGPHIFHTNNVEVWNFVNSFTRFHYYQHRVLSYVQGQYVPFPINLDTVNSLFGTKMTSSELSAFYASEIKRSSYNPSVKSFRDGVVSVVGEKLYDLFFKNYTWKQWQQDPDTLCPELAERIPVRYGRDDRYFTDRFQGIPREGYTRLVEKMLDHSHIALLLGVDYLAVRDQLPARLTIYTGKLDAFFNYQYGELGYRSVALQFEELDCEYYQPGSVINFPNDYAWTRTTEFKYFLNEKSAKTTVLFEYPQAGGEPFYVTLTKENMEKRNRYLNEVNTLELSGRYLFLGRLAEYKYYNMDQVIAAAFEKFAKWNQEYNV